MTRNLTIRGKNLFFLKLLCDCLRIDPSHPYDWSEAKRALTPDAVVAIHQAVQLTWPDSRDLHRVLTAQKEKLAGLYIGQIDPESIESCITRNSLYVDHFLIPDPFQYPGSMNPQYDPAAQPESYGPTTLKNALTWLRLAPWIEAGILSFTRLPSDFDPRLGLHCIELERSRAEGRPELRAFLRSGATKLLAEAPQFKDFQLYLFLSQDRQTVRRYLRDAGHTFASSSDDEIDEAIASMRDQHPYYVDPKSWHREGIRASDIHVSSTGASYEEARIVAEVSSSFLLTDVEYKWMVIKTESEASGLVNRAWTPFAKALGAARLRCLDNVSLAAALTLRKEQRLEGMRQFLRRVWKAAATEDQFAEANAIELAAELGGEVSKAEEEWKRVDTELAKWFGLQLGGAVAALGTGIPLFVAGGGLSVGAATYVAVSMYKHARISRSPAGFFLQRMKS